uniref:Cytochrome P450 n=1 Tax=Oryza glumipatula TaxID=40148 RepID=A0A0E0B7B7_9ORYZ
MDIVRARCQSASVQDIDDVLSSFLIAGCETRSSGLSWFFWLLSSQLDVMARIADVVRVVRKATGGCPSELFGFDALREMYYLHAVLMESMRLYPPALGVRGG